MFRFSIALAFFLFSSYFIDYWERIFEFLNCIIDFVLSYFNSLGFYLMYFEVLLLVVYTFMTVKSS